ncbi:MAG: T9SS type A sorting domain-containing protein [Candidatus Eisenbacteria bacterium]|uniref:T9SS type A sorting domain-containing protein n=1 Tax=Eiseniibacteriota bacterium TaxID=2212470 RepID=A0A933SEM3_UNCEI|nr:T9SS type A sorting domain-containing protein [Candidatus Eisenbacteria bacterium]
MTSDGHDGAFFALADGSQYGTMSWNLRIFRVAADGSRPVGWPVDGIPISQSAWADFPNAGIGNADGSFTLAYIVYDLDARAHVARYTSAGAPVPGEWSGAPILAAFGSHQGVTGVIATADGGNLFAFLQSVGNNSDIWLQHLDSSGRAASGWPTTGRTFVAGTGQQVQGQRPVLVSDRADGAWTTYVSDQIGAEANVYVARIDGLGDPAAGWPAQGFSITSAPGIQTQPAITTDGGSGVYVAWVDARSRAGQPWDQAEFGADIYLQRVNADGSLAAGWPSLGLPVCVWDYPQEVPHVVPDSTGGVFVVWEYSGPQGFTVHAQHVLADGSIAPGWPLNGKRMFGIDGYADLSEVASDQLGGLFVSCEIQTASGWRVYVQHVNAAGDFDSPSGPTGLLVCPPTGPFDSQENPHLIQSLPGSAIVCWDDSRNGYYNTYVQRITANGIVATELSLASHDAQPDRVTLDWAGADASLSSASLERREPEGLWRRLADLTADREGRLHYEDRDVSPGATYEYRVRYASDGQSRTTAVATITVPAATPFALKGATPNPSSRRKLAIAYSLAERAPARLELFDAQGRCVAVRDLSALGLGAHTVTLDEAHELRAGLYWARLTQGTHQATSRVVIVD